MPKNVLVTQQVFTKNTIAFSCKQFYQEGEICPNTLVLIVNYKFVF